MIDCYIKQKVIGKLQSPSKGSWLLTYLFHGDVVRIIKSFSWQEKFEDFAQMFSKLKASLNDAMLLAIHKSTIEIKERTKVSDEKLNQVLVILKKRTDVEHDIARYIQRNGGINRCLERDSMMHDLIAISDNRMGNPLPSVGISMSAGGLTELILGAHPEEWP